MLDIPVKRLPLSDTRPLRTNHCCLWLRRFRQGYAVPNNSISEWHHPRRRLRNRHLRNVHFPSSHQHDASFPTTLVAPLSAVLRSCRRHLLSEMIVQIELQQKTSSSMQTVAYKTLPYEKLFPTASCYSISATFLVAYRIQPSLRAANLSTVFGAGGVAT